MRFTIFTPTFNRGYIIEKLYNSLKVQSFTDFEWIVVDDGSTDNTEEIFNKILKEKNFFEISYIKTQNGGKHRAINVGIKKAKGEMFFIVDSDDMLLKNSLKIVDEIEKTITDKSKFAGVAGQKVYFDGRLVGKTFEGDFLDCTNLETKVKNIAGDKAEVFYTSILKNYPFPEFEGEKFVTEDIVWDRIAYDGYKIRYFNKPIYACEYLDDGLTHNSDLYFKNNPKSYGLYFAQKRIFKALPLCVYSRKVIYYCKNSGCESLKVCAKNLQENYLFFLIKYAFYNFISISYRLKNKIKNKIKNKKMKNSN